MIKGVNRQIIEITEAGNPIFERALLVVRPSFADSSDERIRGRGPPAGQAAGGYSGLRPESEKAAKTVARQRRDGNRRAVSGLPPHFPDSVNSAKKP